MPKTNLIVFSIILGVFIFLIGGFLGMIYQNQTGLLDTYNVDTSEVDTYEASVCKTLLEKADSSPLAILQIIAKGEIVKIDLVDKTISLNSDGDSLILKVSDNANILFFDANTKGNGQRLTDLSQIEEGHAMDAILEIQPDQGLTIKEAVIF